MKSISQCYSRDGFVFARKIIQVDTAQADTRRALSRSQLLVKSEFINGAKYVIGSSGCSRIEWIRYELPMIHRIFHDPELLTRAKDLLGVGSLDIIISQLNFRVRGDGISYAWHRDLQSDKGVFSSSSPADSTVMVFVALSAIGDEDSPISLIPGSHLDPLENPELYGNSVLALMEPGDVLFMNPAVLHRSTVHTSDTPRFLAITAFCKSGEYSRLRPDFDIDRHL